MGVHQMVEEGCRVLYWCSDLDFSLHAFRMRIEYFFMKPVEEQKIKEGFSIWFERRNVI